MTLSAALVERRRLEECAREPIRTPGRIQSHGMLLGVDVATGFVTLASENASSWLARPIAELDSASLDWAIRSGTPVDPTRVDVLGAQYDAIVHHLGSRAIVELEPAVVSLEYARTSVVGAIQRLATIHDADRLRAAAADEIRTITGFDRVMVYDFKADEHGEVAAESRVDEMEPYLGLHFPASDIPLQARDLYLTKLSRAIVSTTDPGSPLLALDEDAAGTDLSQAELRAVSPFHLQFMRNMGQESTVSFSLVDDNRLAGMITCAHRTPRRMPVLLRRALEVLATQLQLQLTSIARIEGLTHSLRVVEQRTALLAPLYASEDITDALLDGERTVLDLVPADGVVVCIGESVRPSGDVPSSDDISRLLDATRDRPIVTDSLAADHPDLVPLTPGFAGLLIVTFGEVGDRLIFFRREVARHVNWLGDQSPDNRAAPLSPRLSFSAWRESVSGTAPAWGRVAQEAADLGHELHVALARRSEGRLAQLAMRDALTGLHNRRFLLERLDTAHTTRVGGRALLFIDLDDFKAVNDTLGHEVGDAVLVEIARRLEAAARVDDTVARLGGDEFVIVCDDIEPEAAMAVAARIVEAIAQPIEVGGGEHSGLVVTGSCGVAIAAASSTASDWLDEADNAMYRAKRSGRNQASA